MVAPRTLVFRPLVKGSEDSGNEIGGRAKKIWGGSLFFIALHQGLSQIILSSHNCN